MFSEPLIIQELWSFNLSHTNGPLRLICQGTDVPAGEKVAEDGIKSNHKQMLPFICWPHTVIEGLYHSETRWPLHPTLSELSVPLGLDVSPFLTFSFYSRSNVLICI